MVKLTRLVLAAALFAAIAPVLATSCATPAILTPKTGPNTDYPCGLNGHSCGGGMCCDNGSECGGQFSSCPAGECCFHGASPGDFGARKPVKQRPESR